MVAAYQKDFFISRNGKDGTWAQWIAWELEDAGYSIVLQDWDFRPGQNFVLKMQNAATNCHRTLAVLSPHFLAAEFTQPEWAAAFVQDPKGEKAQLLFVRVEGCTPPGLLTPIIYIDLIGLDEDAARVALLEGVQQSRAKPKTRPAFPGVSKKPVARKPAFPGPIASLPAIWNVPHLKNLNFTGREHLLIDLRRALSAGSAAAVTAIHGLGGVGKTQVATEYTYRHASDYQIIWWIRSEDSAQLASDYAALARELDLPEKDDTDERVIVRAVRNWLEHHGDWLLVFDNVGMPDDIDEHRPHGGAGHILITSRHHSWRGVAAEVPVDVWERDDSIDFLLKRTDRSDREGAGKVAEALGNLPLALAQAGSYMEETGLPFADYGKLLRTSEGELLRRGTAFTGYDLIVATTWNASFEKLEAENGAAAGLLNLCAFLAPDDIPFDVIRGGGEFLPEPLASATQDDLNFNDAVAALLRYSLVEVADDALSVHRLVQAITRDRLTDQEHSWSDLAVKTVNRAFPFGSGDARNWPVCARLTPHALTAAGHAEDTLGAPAETARLLNQVGIYLKGRAQFDEAKAAIERALRINEGVYGLDHPRVATNLSNLGGVLLGLGDLTRAREIYEHAIRIDEGAYGPDHVEVAADVNNLGGVLHDLGDLPGARAAYERALRTFEQAYGPDDPNVATCVNNLGGVLQILGDLSGARASFERALRIDEQAYGPDHPDVATRLNNLGNVLRTQGDLSGARVAYERALRILRQFLGDEHPDTITVRNNLESLG